jgi:hypothetical protein
VFDLAEERRDLLSLFAGGLIGRGRHQGLGVVTGLLIGISREPALPAARALRLQWTDGAVAPLGDVFDGIISVNAARGFQLLAAGTDVKIAVLTSSPRGGSPRANC